MLLRTAPVGCGGFGFFKVSGMAVLGWGFFEKVMGEEGF